MDTQFKNPTMLSLSFRFPLSQNIQKTEHIVEQKEHSSLPLDEFVFRGPEETFLQNGGRKFK